MLLFVVCNNNDVNRIDNYNDNDKKMMIIIRKIIRIIIIIIIIMMVEMKMIIVVAIGSMLETMIMVVFSWNHKLRW